MDPERRDVAIGAAIAIVSLVNAGLGVSDGDWIAAWIGIATAVIGVVYVWANVYRDAA